MPSAVNQVGRSLWKYNQWPSVVRLGEPSMKALFTTGPRLTGVCQQSSKLSRFASQRSGPPSPFCPFWSGPGRFDSKMRLKPSLETVGWLSLDDELTTAGQGGSTRSLVGVWVAGCAPRPELVAGA